MFQRVSLGKLSYKGIPYDSFWAVSRVMQQDRYNNVHLAISVHWRSMFVHIESLYLTEHVLFLYTCLVKEILYFSLEEVFIWCRSSSFLPEIFISIHPFSVNSSLVQFRVRGRAGVYPTGHRARGRNTCWTGRQFIAASCTWLLNISGCSQRYLFAVQSKC